LALMPQAFMRVIRMGSEGVERIAFIGYVDASEHDAAAGISTLKLRAPESLILESFEPPFPLPLSEHITAPQVFQFWWKQAGFVFSLPDPPLVPAAARRPHGRRAFSGRALRQCRQPSCW
jgi:hypothetical protein